MDLFSPQASQIENPEGPWEIQLIHCWQMSQCLYISVVIPGGTPVSVWSLLFISKRKKCRIGNFVPFSKSSNGGKRDHHHQKKKPTNKPLSCDLHTLSKSKAWSLFWAKDLELSQGVLPWPHPCLLQKRAQCIREWVLLLRCEHTWITGECLWPYSACEYSSSYVWLCLQSLDRNNST